MYLLNLWELSGHIRHGLQPKSAVTLGYVRLRLKKTLENKKRKKRALNKKRFYIYG